MRKSRYCLNESPVYISDRMTGKMHGIPCIGTSCQNNKYCRARLGAGVGVCKHCFAMRTQKCYKAVYSVLSENEFLKFRALEDSEIPRFKKSVEIVRFEAFGDLETPLQFTNYWKIAKANPHVKFALWTKNPHLVHAANLPKLTNLTLVFSSLQLNEPEPLPEKFDHVFTVYTADQISEKRINCGARSCLTCRRCYTRRTGSEVRELLK